MRRIGLAVMLAFGLAFASVDVEAQSPAVAGAKQVGWLGLVPLPRLMAEFQRGMRELGYVEGTTYALVALYAGDKPEMLQPCHRNVGEMPTKNSKQNGAHL